MKAKSILIPLGFIVLPLSVVAQKSDHVSADLSCSDAFIAYDKDNDGLITEAEAPEVYARGRLVDIPVAAEGMSRADYEVACTNGDFKRVDFEKGAPFAGANSFTEEQAIDRALATGINGISSLVIDDDGIWRGTGTLDGNPVNIAVDYKGNVVPTSENGAAQ